jgi:hypothetical protein
MRNSPMSFVVADRPYGVSRTWPCDTRRCIGMTTSSATGSPNSSMTRPVMTPPRGSVTSMRSSC